MSWVLETAIGAGALAFVALAVDRVAGRGRWPGLRHALWALVALRLVVPPGVVSPLGQVPGTSPAGVVQGTSIAVAPSEGVPLLIVVWAAGFALLGARALLRRRALWRWVGERGREAPDAAHAALRAWCERLGLRRVPRLVVLPGIESPAVAGLLRPVVLLPPAAAVRGTLGHALLHELTHLRRRDLWAQAAFSVVALLAWFHPAAWLARSRSRALREIGCDLAAARVLGRRAPEYRRSLLEEAALRLLAPAGGVAGWGGGGSLLLARLAALESVGPAVPRMKRAVAAVAVLVLGALALPAVPGCGGAPASFGAIEEARAHLARTLTERDRFGCFHRMDAWIRLRALEDAAASTAADTP